MFDPHVVLTVLVLYVAIVVSPGPNFALISKLALPGERTTAWGATLGMACAAPFYGVLTMTGLAIVLERIGWLTRAVQIAGGLYLVWLGIQSWRHAGAVGLEQGTTGYGTVLPRTIAFLRGLRLGGIVNLSNRKGIVFFIGLYAVTVPPDAALLTKAAILTASFVVEMAWYGFTILLLSSPPARAVYVRAGAWIERVIGIVLIAFGTRIAMARN